MTRVKIIPAWSTHLVVKLVRGLPGTIRKHRIAVRNLGLPKRGHTAVVPNTPTNLGVVEQVKRLIQVETLEMYMERIQKEIKDKECRPPIVMKHASPAKANEQKLD